MHSFADNKFEFARNFRRLGNVKITAGLRLYRVEAAKKSASTGA